MPGLGGALAIGAGLGGLAGGIGSGVLAGQQGVSGTDIRHLTGGVRAGGLRTGFSGSPKNRVITVEDSKERDRLIDSIAGLFGQQADELGRLRGQLAPGFGALTRARRQAIENAARRSVGNLTDQLARRRVLGSSFAADAITRAGRQFGEALAESDAQSFLQELNANINVLNAQSEAGRAKFQTFLDELNLQTNLALQILTGSQAAVSNAFQTANALRAQFQRDLVTTVTGATSAAGVGGAAELAGVDLAKIFGASG